MGESAIRPAPNLAWYLHLNPGRYTGGTGAKVKPRACTEPPPHLQNVRPKTAALVMWVQHRVMPNTTEHDLHGVEEREGGGQAGVLLQAASFPADRSDRGLPQAGLALS